MYIISIALGPPGRTLSMCAVYVWCLCVLSMCAVYVCCLCVVLAGGPLFAMPIVSLCDCCRACLSVLPVHCFSQRTSCISHQIALSNYAKLFALVVNSNEDARQIPAAAPCAPRATPFPEENSY